MSCSSPSALMTPPAASAPRLELAVLPRTRSPLKRHVVRHTRFLLRSRATGTGHAKRIPATCLSLALGTSHRCPNRNIGVGGRTAAFSRRVSPELCLVAPPSCPRGRREGRVLTSHPRSAARKAHAGKPHSSIQVVPITRPPNFGKVEYFRNTALTRACQEMVGCFARRVTATAS